MTSNFIVDGGTFVHQIPATPPPLETEGPRLVGGNKKPALLLVSDRRIEPLEELALQGPVGMVMVPHLNVKPSPLNITPSTFTDQEEKKEQVRKRRNFAQVAQNLEGH